MKVRVHLKSGKTITLKNVKEFTFNRQKISWRTTGNWAPLYIEPTEVEAIEEYRWRLFS